MLQTSNLLGFLWWGSYTILAIWAQRFLPGVDLLAPGIVLSMQEHGGYRTFWLATAWVLLLEGIGNMPFGFGVAWYGLLVVFYIVGRWLFEARSVPFMFLLGVGLGLLRPLLVYSLGTLASLQVPLRPLLLESLAQALLFPIVWILIDRLFPKRLRLDVRPL